MVRRPDEAIASQQAESPPRPTLSYCGLNIEWGRAIPYVPGRFAPHHHGIAALDLMPTSVVVWLGWKAPDTARDAVPEGVGAEEAKVACAEARRQFRAVREAFLNHAAFLRHNDLESQLHKLQGQMTEAEKAPAIALAEARAAMLKGDSAEPAEERFRRATAEKAILENRHAAMQGASKMAKSNAENELAKRLETARADMEADAAATARRLADELTRELESRLAALRAADELCVYLSSNSAVIRNTVAGQIATLEFAKL